MDLSSCVIRGLAVSDNFSELRGLKISTAQAQDLAGLLGVSYIEAQ